MTSNYLYLSCYTLVVFTPRYNMAVVTMLAELFITLPTSLMFIWFTRARIASDILV